MKVRTMLAGAVAGVLIAGAAGHAVFAGDEARIARIGEAAPAFSLTDTTGATHSLAQYSGKIVVLEWFNPDCPFVKKHHQANKTMHDTAARYKDRNVVWLAINSSAAGKQGAGQERNARAITEYGIEYPVLLDGNGDIGRAYGARCTPTMCVIDAQGHLAYEGAIDDNRSPDTVGTNLVAAALDAVIAGRPVAQPETQAYGCGVKY